MLHVCKWRKSESEALKTVSMYRLLTPSHKFGLEVLRGQLPLSGLFLPKEPGTL